MQSQINHTMLSNGLDFLSTGLREINSGNNKDLKYGVLHIFAGTLLIMKERLRQEHWTLLFAKLDKINIRAYKSGDFSGVDYRILLDHLENVLEIQISEVDRRSLEEFRKIRNRIEHFAFEYSAESIKTISGKILQFTVDFMTLNFDIDELSPDEGKVLGDIKKSASEFKEYVDAKLALIHQRMVVEQRDIFHCPECFIKSLVREDSDFFCGVCGLEGPSLDEIVDAHLSMELNMNSYSAGKEGYDLPIYECSECSEEASVPLNSAGHKFICISCGDQVKTDSLHSCARCGNLFHGGIEDSTEGSGGLCARCWREELSKE